MQGKITGASFLDHEIIEARYKGVDELSGGRICMPFQVCLSGIRVENKNMKGFPDDEGAVADPSKRVVGSNADYNRRSNACSLATIAGSLSPHCGEHLAIISISSEG